MVKWIFCYTCEENGKCPWATEETKDTDHKGHRLKED